MCDYHRVALRMAHKKGIQRGLDSSLERGGALTAWDQVPARLFSPLGPRFRVALDELFGAQAFPVAQEDLAQLRHPYRLKPCHRLDRLGSLARPLQVARIQRQRALSHEAVGDKGRLTSAFLGERRIELPLDPMNSIPGRLAMADEVDPRRRRPGGCWVFRRLRAR